MKRILISVVVLALALSFSSAWAQDDPELADFSSSDEMLTFSYPADWFVSELTDEMETFPTILIAPSEDAAAQMEAPEQLDEQIEGIVLYLLPTDLFAQVGMEIPEGSTPTELAEMFATNVLGIQPGMADEEATPAPGMAQLTSEPQEMKLSDELIGGYAAIADPESEGFFIVYELEQDILVALTGVAPLDTMDEDMLATARIVAATLDYTGTGEELMNTMMGGGMPAEEEPMATEEAEDMEPATQATEEASG